MRIRVVTRWLMLGLLALPTLVPFTASAAPSRKALAITVTTAQGNVALESLRGKVVLVDFWASWCVPCHKSFPWLDAVQKKYAAQGLTVLAVNVDKERAAADGFLAQHPVSFTVGYDPSGKAAEAMHVSGMPSTFLVGRDGILLASHIGFDPKKTAAFEHAIEEALKP
jgi:thiol-disulfide isomerase/thioredoxin